MTSGVAISGLNSVAVLGAHCDDIVIGMGATLFDLCHSNPGLSVHALVLTGADTPRASEEAAALEMVTPSADLTLKVCGFPDGRTPHHWMAVKDTVRQFRNDMSPPDLVFGPQRRDAHQDHRQLAELIPTEFRSANALGYEIAKWENDLPQPTVLIPVSDEAVAAKVDTLFDCYPSQFGHDWFDREAFFGLMRIRGIGAHTRYAEGFVADKLVVQRAGPPTDSEDAPARRAHR